MADHSFYLGNRSFYLGSLSGIYTENSTFSKNMLSNRHFSVATKQEIQQQALFFATTDVLIQIL